MKRSPTDLVRVLRFLKLSSCSSVSSVDFLPKRPRAFPAATELALPNHGQPFLYGGLELEPKTRLPINNLASAQV